jgi:hypothetical protein
MKNYFIMHLLRRLILWIIPLTIAFLILYFGNPSDERCREVVIQNLRSEGIEVSVDSLFIKNGVIAKSIRYRMSEDTFRIATASVLKIKMRDFEVQRLKNVIQVAR